MGSAELLIGAPPAGLILVECATVPKPLFLILFHLRRESTRHTGPEQERDGRSGIVAQTSLVDGHGHAVGRHNVASSGDFSADVRWGQTRKRRQPIEVSSRLGAVLQRASSPLSTKRTANDAIVEFRVPADSRRIDHDGRNFYASCA